MMRSSSRQKRTPKKSKGSDKRNDVINASGKVKQHRKKMAAEQNRLTHERVVKKKMNGRKPPSSKVKKIRAGKQSQASSSHEKKK
jgi:hypothetical protein